MANPIVIDLESPGEYLSEDSFYVSSDRGTEMTRKISLPLISSNFESSDRSGEVFFAEIFISEEIDLKGTIQIEAYDEIDREEEDEFEFVIEDLKVTLDSDALECLVEQGELPMALTSGLAISESTKEEAQDKNKDIDLEELEVELSMIIPLEENEEGEKEFEYFFLPDHTEATVEEGVDRSDQSISGDFLYTNIWRPEIEPPSDSRDGGLGRVFRIRFLAREIKKVLKRAKKAGKELGLESVNLHEFIIEQLEKSPPIQKRLEKAYKIKKIDLDSKGDVLLSEITAEEVDPSKKTLILLHGAFDKSLKWKKNKWKGSFKYFTQETGGQKTGFAYLLKEGPFEQIIAFDHDTVIHGVYENIAYLIEKRGIGSLNFAHPPALFSSSRGGKVAQFLTLMAGGGIKIPSYLEEGKELGKEDLGFSVHKFITVAAGQTGYVDPSTAEDVKKGFEIFLSILNFLTPGLKQGLGWVFSLSIDLLRNMPGLKMQATDSPESKILQNSQLDDVWSLAFANNHTKEGFPFRFIEKKLVDRFLGMENDYVISYESQQRVRPGNILPGFEPVLGDFIHGKGMSEEAAREKVGDFLKATEPVETDPGPV